MAFSNNDYTFKLCTVEYVDDESKGFRIKVVIPNYDSGKNINQVPTRENNGDGVPWCFPMLPKMMHVAPKVGELVFVFMQQPSSGYSQRLYVGPVISQDVMMNYDPDYVGGEDGKLHTSARRLLNGYSESNFTPFANPDEDGNNEGTLPDREDIAIRGRNNTDIILKDNDIRIRCGFKEKPNGSISERLKFNDKDLAYILLRYRKGSDKTSDYNSSITLVGDRINLLSHDSPTYFDMGDKKDLISDECMDKILDKAHQLPYGDVLIDFLKEFVNVFNTHVHPYNGVKPAIKDITPNWESMLSKSVRIN